MAPRGAPAAAPSASSSSSAAAASAAHVALWASHALSAKAFASRPRNGGRAFAAACALAAAAQLLACCAALRRRRGAGLAALAGRVAAETRAAAGLPLLAAAACRAAACTVGYYNLAFIPIATWAALLAARCVSTELFRALLPAKTGDAAAHAAAAAPPRDADAAGCARALCPSAAACRLAGAAACAAGAAALLRAKRPFNIRLLFVLAQAALLAAEEALAAAAARARARAPPPPPLTEAGGGGPEDDDDVAGALAEQQLTPSCLTLAACFASWLVTAAWAAGGGADAAAARHAQAACHGRIATMQALAHRGLGAAAAGIILSAAASFAGAARGRAAPPAGGLETLAAVGGGVLLCALGGAAFFREALPRGSVALATAAVIFGAAAHAAAAARARAARVAAAAAPHAAAAAALPAAKHAGSSAAGSSKLLDELLAEEAAAAASAAAAAAAAARRRAHAAAAAASGPWLRHPLCAAAAVVYLSILFGLAAQRGMWFWPADARLSSYDEAPDAPLAQCASPPPLWAPPHGAQPAPYVVRKPGACDAAGAAFYNLSSAPHYGTRLTMWCPGGTARYTPNFLDDDVAATVAGVTREVAFEPGAAGAAVTFSHKITHLELTCTQPGRAGSSGSAKGASARAALRGGGATSSVTRREVALLPGPLARALAQAGPAPPSDAELDAVPDAAAARPSSAQATDARPNVVVILLDALSRQTAESVLPAFLAQLRTPHAYAPSVAAALEYGHFAIVGMNSKPNWAALLCGGNCSGPGSLNAALPLFDAARAAGFATAAWNNFFPGYPYPWLRTGAGPEVTVPELYAKLHPGDATDCRMRDSVSKSWLSACIGALAAPRRPGAAPVFALLAPHEAHSKKAYDYDRLKRLEPDLIQALRVLNVSGVLATSLTLLISDHGIHFGRFHGQLKERHAPASAAHRSPFLWALLGADVAPALLGVVPDKKKSASANDDVALALARAARNAGRLVTMHDAYAVLADALGVRGDGAAPGAPGGRLRVTPHEKAINFLREEVPEGRSCREAGVPPGYCACFRRRSKGVGGGAGPAPWMDFKC
jgi:hypothetical protein